MANMLLEKYAKKVQLAESVYAKAHNGEKMDNMKKMVVAKCLDNVNKFLNESLEGLNTAATQRTAMGEYKKFCMALTNVGIPNLIAFDLVAVSPMSAISGNVAYIEYVKGTDKGQSKAGDLTNNIWQLGDVDTNYTGNAVVETVTGSETNISALGFAPIDGTLQANTGTDGAWQDVTVGADGAITITGATKVKYLYDNVVVPQTVLPTLKAKLTNIALEAKARRIAIYYSQMAAFQAKTDYGFSLADGLAEQAVGQLSYEIDTEIVNMLLEAAPTTTEIASFSKTQPVGVALSEHYAAFAAKIEEYKMFIYKKTKKFAPNFMVVASDIMPILTFVPGFQAASISEINGPYFAGSINGIKVFVSPMLEAGDFFLGVNQGAMQASAGVYAPYMPVVPTQLLEMPDGLNQQGWATMYDAKILNADLLVRGAVVA
jgi:hypothetical protein